MRLIFSRADFSSRNGTSYTSPVRKPTHNPEHQVMNVREENRKNNSLNKVNMEKTNKNKYITKSLPEPGSHSIELFNKEYKSQNLTRTKCVSKTTILAKTEAGDNTNPKP